MPEQICHVLIVDDDPTMRALVAGYLEREQLIPVEAASAAEMWRCLERGSVDLVLLDVRLPDGDGFELLRRLRAKQATPVIMMTGVDTAVDRVVGLDGGADDYVGKPFEPRELVARIRSVLRRSGAPGFADGPEGGVLQFAGWSLDTTRRRLTAPDGTVVALTGGEFNLLNVLAQAPNRPLSRDQLLEATQARQWTPYDRSVDVLIGRLRKKVEIDAARPELIKTVRGVGYVLAVTVQRQPAPVGGMRIDPASLVAGA